MGTQKLLFILLFLSQGAIASYNDYIQLFQDPFDLIDSHLIPTQKKDIERVVFWMRIYDEWAENTLVVHDKINSEKVYGVFDLKSFYTNATPLKQINRKISSHELDVLSTVKNFLLSYTPKSKKPSWFPQETFNTIRLLKKDKISLLSDRLRVQRGLRRGFQKALQVSHPYFLDMEKIFSKKGLNPMLTRICIVESMFNPYSVSKSGAIGVWQIMPEIQSAFMNDPSHVDERIDPLKSTLAASELIKENLLLLDNNLPLAVVAYNQGVSEILKNYKNRLFRSDSFKFLREFHSERFKFSGQNYYYEFLAALYLQIYDGIDWKNPTKKPVLARN